MEADLALLRHELSRHQRPEGMAGACRHRGHAQSRWRHQEGTAGAGLGPERDGWLAPFFLGIAFRHRWPRFDRLAMRFDDRAGYKLDDRQKLWIEPAEHGGLFAWWLHPEADRGAKAQVLLPIRGWGRDRDDEHVGVGLFRPGVLGKTVERLSWATRASSRWR